MTFELPQRLGGGSTVFCKSGKDRTAMQVTFKQAQFLQRFIDKKDANSIEDVLPFDEVFANSTLMRIHGTRVPICEKNAGESKYAFNPLQAKVRQTSCPRMIVICFQYLTSFSQVHA